jgi:DNA sulfur modification protein DndB
MTIQRNEGLYFYGELVTEESLNETETEKRRDYIEGSINRSEQENYFSDGWAPKKMIRNKVIIVKKKDDDEIFEDYVWLLFKSMGFKEMNRDRNFKIQTNVNPKQIDVFAKDDDNVFVIECKTGTPSLIKDIQEILYRRKDIIDSIEKYYKKKFRVSFIIITKNINWSESDEKLAKDNEKNCFFFWKEDDLEAYKMLVSQLGHAAKYQLYGLLFPEREASEVGEITVPAMRGGIGDNKYYCFLIQPEKLFKIAYVHRREKSNPEEIKKAYQRMINKKRIEQIGKFINNGNSFPNNIILSFRRPPEFSFGKKLKKRTEFKSNKKSKKEKEIIYGTLKFPPYYGCAWIIDGQHRLYGYSKSEHAADHTIPVIAFESLNVRDQANLFVDINQEQKSVNKNLLWDLYPDIYEGSEDEEQQILRAISLVAKKLNYDKDSVFNNHIQIPSILTKSKGEFNLTLTNICEGIKDNRLIIEKEKLLFKENYEETVNFTTEIIKAYFESVVHFLSSDWERGERGLIRTNIGIRIFFIILRQLLRYLNYEGKGSIYTKKDLTEFKNEVKKILASPEGPLTKLEKMTDREKDSIRGESNKKLVLKNTQKLLWYLKEKTNFGLELWREGGWTPDVPSEDTDEKIKNLIEDTEIKVILFITKKLKETYGDLWWEKGVNVDIKNYIEERVIPGDVKIAPWKEKEEVPSMPPERKLIKASTAAWRMIITDDNNWKQFQDTFAKEKENISVSLKFFENIRNKYLHPARKIDLTDIEKGLGYWNMRWIRRCIGLDTPECIK